MIKKITIADILLMGSALLSLIYSETLWYKGEKESAIFRPLGTVDYWL